MKNSSSRGKYAANVWITFRATPDEKKRLMEQADIGGLSISEYMRRREFGGRPLVAQTDIMMVGELRRIGGLLKHNFETMRLANAGPECFRKQEEALRMLSAAIEKIASNKNYLQKSFTII